MNNEIDLNDKEFNYGGSINGMVNKTNGEMIEFANIYSQRAMDEKYHMENENFDTSIFLHRVWIINYILNLKGLKRYIITRIRSKLQQEGIESAEYEHELVIMRINNLFGDKK